MATLRLTQGYVNRATPEQGEFHWDLEMRGLGLRVRPGAKTWLVFYRTLSGQQRRMKLAAFSTFTLEEARREAKKVLGKVANGKDPAGERHALKAAATVKELAADYMKRHARPAKSPGEADKDEAKLRLYVLPKLGAKKAADVSRRDIEDLHLSMSDTPGAANRVLSLLSKMFSLAVKWGLRLDNPVKGVERNAENKREAWLSDGELSTVLECLNDLENERAANAIRLLLLTGARMREVLHARWDQFDLSAGTWTKPASTTKQKKLHHVQLSAPALILLGSLFAQAKADAARQAEVDGEEPVVSPFVFPSEVEGKPLDSIRRSWGSLMEAAKLGRWEVPEGRTGGKPEFRSKYRIHDLRHTVASHMVTAGVSLAVVKETLGHSNIATTMRYAHLAPSAVKAAADQYGAKLVALGGGKPAAEVVEFPKGSAAVA